MKPLSIVLLAILLSSSLFAARLFAADSVPKAPVEGQPLGANVLRLIEALEYLGQPLGRDMAQALRAAAAERDADTMQEILDQQVLFVVSLNPEVRVKVSRGPAKATLQQAGFTCHLVKVLNNSTVTRSLRIMSPQSGPVYAGAAESILKRQAQTELGAVVTLDDAKKCAKLFNENKDKIHQAKEPKENSI